MPATRVYFNKQLRLADAFNTQSSNLTHCQQMLVLITLPHFPDILSDFPSRPCN